MAKDEQAVTVDDTAQLSDVVGTGAADASSDDNATSLPEQKFIVYGEYYEIPDGEGGTAMVERTYPEPMIVDEIAPNQRGNHLPIEE